tara:strand:+ start:279 stop:617 length:339 start_codon:yes stop_codon:yes gene_type:complete
MKVWVMQGIHEGDLFSSVHLTEKGAALAAITDVLDFLGVDDEETALRVMDNLSNYGLTEKNGEQTEPFEWRDSKLKEMTRSELWSVFSAWAELTWSNDYGYQVDVMVKEITA